jgi:probable phosphoglycerate mutase
MKKIILVRHGETAWNLEGRTQGRKDSCLTEKGLYQAKLLGKRLKGEAVDLIYSSSLARARSTAQIIGEELSLDCHIREDLAEMGFGLWEGLTSNEIISKYPLESKAWHTTPHLLCVPEGEKLEIAQERISKAMEKIIMASGDKNTLVVSHGIIIKLYLLSFLNMSIADIYKLRQDNCSINVIEFGKRGPVLAKYNDTSYMDIMTEGGTIEQE